MIFTIFVRTLTASEQPSLMEEIWTYLVDRYFSIDWSSYRYEHVSIGNNGIISLRTGVAAILLGVILAAAIAMFQKRTLGDLVRAIDREECQTPESAKTLEELGLLRNAAIKSDLRHGSSLRRVVRCVEEEAWNASCAEKKATLQSLAETGDPNAIAELKKYKEVPYRLNFATDHFYIPESLIYGAVDQFDKRGSTPLSLVLCMVLCVVLLAAVCFFLPELLQLTDNMIGMFT